MNNVWTVKIQTLLYPYPPDFALDPDKDGARERAKEYLRSLELNDSVPRHVEQAHEIAFGLDVPSFIRDEVLPTPRDQLILTHPLSGESETATLDANQLKSTVQQALGNFKGLKNDPKRLFIALWRFLAEVVHSYVVHKQAPNPYWGLLPADPRIPDHSIWDHASLASAVAGTWDENEQRHKPALLIFNIASAQEFLMTARRTQDLWMGSYLLSYLTWEAIKVIADNCGPDCLIYPDLRGQPLTDLWLFQEILKENWTTLGGRPFLKHRDQDEGLGEDLKIASFPNMFTAIVPQDQASRLAQEAVDAVHDNWKRIMEDVLEKVEEAIQKTMSTVKLDCDSWRDRWEKQDSDLIDRLGVFWVVYPLDRAPGQKDGDAKVQQAIKEFNDLIKLEAGEAENAFKDFEKLYAISKGKANIGMGYSVVSQLAARTLTNRKSLRDFRQHPAPGEKCSLCGVRSALHPDGQGGYQELRKFWEDLARVEADITLNGQTRKVKLAGRIRRGDRLCAACLTKRLAWEHHFIPQFKKILNAKVSEAHLLFPSASSIATAPFKKKIMEKLQKSDPDAGSLKKSVDEYVSKVLSFLQPNNGQGPYDIYYYSAPIPALEKLVPKELSDFTRIDGEWLFDESFVPEKIEREYDVKKEELQGLEEAKAAAADLRRMAEEILKIKPSKYYALIAMDGDHMGQWVSGQNGPPLLKLLHPDIAKTFTDDPELKDLLCRKRPLGPTLHMALTAAQKNFALQVVRQIVEEEHVGKLIYAGGDDVLAFMPIEELLPVLRKLRWLCSGEPVDDLSSNAKLENVSNGFATRVNNTNDKRRFMLLGSEFSLSAGVAIVHHTHPFSHAVEEAYRAMKEHAKSDKKLGRNAFAIHLMKRSGEPLEVGAKWKLDDTLNTLFEVEQIVEAMAERWLSGKLAYDLNDEALGMAKLGKDAQVGELRRLIARHVSKKEKLEGTTKRITKLLAGLQAQDPAEAWKRLIHLLLLARFLAQGGGDGGE